MRHRRWQQRPGAGQRRRAGGSAPYTRQAATMRERSSAASLSEPAQWGLRGGFGGWSPTSFGGSSSSSSGSSAAGSWVAARFRAF
ncbi:hypothetical protein BZL29_1646 [Mycobacterium kansasii]|uniref:Uncharacterized protein n=1 Tax=Mycobacterium kansasii TaxID=1768 RepID=A0A1V3XNI6_MYCKA|nr:hypothetical protein BZL29_1646 [Mycobacterium kansasii]